MRIAIPGGSGQVGRVLARHFAARGDQVVLISRRPGDMATGRWAAWDGKTMGAWKGAIDGADVVINLAGRSVNCRYNEANKREMMDSRIDSTRIVGEAIAAAKRPPKVWLQASTATIYSHRFDASNDDVTGVIGGSEPDVPAYWKFSIDIAQAWERELEEAKTPNTRKVAMRSAMTMSPDRGGIFDTLLGLVKRGLGGHSGSGRQYVSWIHEQDFARAVSFLIERDDLSGPVNLASPNPLPNRDLMAALRKAWGIRIGLPAPEFLLKIGAVFIGTDVELILKSRRVVPTRLLEAGFKFDFPEWSTAARDLCERWRRAA